MFSVHLNKYVKLFEKKQSKKFDSFVLRPIIMFLRFWKHFYREKIWKFLKTILLTWNWYVYTCVLVHVYTLFKCSNVSYSLKFSFKVQNSLNWAKEHVWLCKLQLFSSKQHNHFVNPSGQFVPSRSGQFNSEKFTLGMILFDLGSIVPELDFSFCEVRTDRSKKRSWRVES